MRDWFEMFITYGGIFLFIGLTFGSYFVLAHVAQISFTVSLVLAALFTISVVAFLYAHARGK